MNVEMLLFTDVIVFTRRRSSTKKLVVTKQMHFLDRVKFIKSEISSTSIVVLYLDEHGMLANAMMLEMGEKDRDKWMEDVSKAQVWQSLLFCMLLSINQPISKKAQYLIHDLISIFKIKFL